MTTFPFGTFDEDVLTEIHVEESHIQLSKDAVIELRKHLQYNVLRARVNNNPESKYYGEKGYRYVGFGAAFEKFLKDRNYQLIYTGRPKLSKAIAQWLYQHDPAEFHLNEKVRLNAGEKAALGRKINEFAASRTSSPLFKITRNFNWEEGTYNGNEYSCYFHIENEPMYGQSREALWHNGWYAFLYHANEYEGNGRFWFKPDFPAKGLTTAFNFYGFSSNDAVRVFSMAAGEPLYCFIVELENEVEATYRGMPYINSDKGVVIGHAEDMYEYFKSKLESVNSLEDFLSQYPPKRAIDHRETVVDLMIDNSMCTAHIVTCPHCGDTLDLYEDGSVKFMLDGETYFTNLDIDLSKTPNNAAFFLHRHCAQLYLHERIRSMHRQLKYSDEDAMRMRDATKVLLLKEPTITVANIEGFLVTVPAELLKDSIQEYQQLPICLGEHGKLYENVWVHKQCVGDFAQGNFHTGEIFYYRWASYSRTVDTHILSFKDKYYRRCAVSKLLYPDFEVEYSPKSGFVSHEWKDQLVFCVITSQFYTEYDCKLTQLGWVHKDSLHIVEQEG